MSCEINQKTRSRKLSSVFDVFDCRAAVDGDDLCGGEVSIYKWVYLAIDKGAELDACYDKDRQICGLGEGEAGFIGGCIFRTERYPVSFMYLACGASVGLVEIESANAAGYLEMSGTVGWVLRVFMRNFAMGYVKSVDFPGT